MNNYGVLPEPLSSFMIYIDTIRGNSKKTADEYFYDLRMFYRFLKIHFKMVSYTVDFDLIDISDVNIEILSKVNTTILYEYMNFLNRYRQNTARSRARKIASLRTFFKFVCNKAKLLNENPTLELEAPKIEKTLPKYLNINDSLDLLGSIDGRNAARDICIITFFLNCGLRLSELVSINIFDIRVDTLTVVGKGNKERTIYLNDACLNVFEQYMKVRQKINAIGIHKNALFLSDRRQRISRRTVQYLVEKYVKKAGLDPQKYTTHKLRHTAATLMYQAGVDIKILQEILGHEHLSTTEIYTHVDNAQLREAVSKNPLSNVKSNIKSEND